MKNFLRVLGFVKNYKGYAFLSVVFNILYVIANLFSFFLFIPVLNILFLNDSATDLSKYLEPNPNGGISMKFVEYELQQWSAEVILAANDIVSGKEQVLISIAAILILSFFMKNVFRYLGMYFIAPIRLGVVNDIRKGTHSKLLKLPISFFSNEKKGDIMSRMTNDVNEVEWSILQGLEAIFREPVAIVGTLSILFYMNWELALFTVVLTPISAAIIGIIGNSLKKTSVKAQNKMGDVLAIIDESLTGLKVIKAFVAEGFVDGKFKKASTDLYRIMLRAYRKRDLASPLSEFLGATMIFIVLVKGGYTVFTGELNGSSFMGFLLLMYTILGPIKGIASAYNNVQKGAAAMDRIKMILDAENNITSKQNASKIERFESEIEFKNVSFSYEEDSVLNGIDLKISKGKSVALVGQSGGGKSTLADLIPRFYDVSDGSILIDGTDIRDIDLNSLRAQISVVTQDSILFNDTIRTNISFGGSYSDEQIIEAAKIANAMEFIDQLPEGLDTVIGDRGDKLSGGQRQRLCIARAVLKNPPILILDEATSALDTHSEKLVQEALNNVMQNRTSVVIAHRLSTIQHADEIVVLDKGEIVERGNHDELIAKEGKYFTLCQMQSFQ